MRNLIFLIGFTAFLFTGCGHDEHAQHESAKYLVTTPEIRDTVIYQEYVCQIRAIQHIELRALEKGYLQEIYVDEGQLVKKGQPIFQITPVVYQAEMLKAQAEVNYADIEYLNTKALSDSNIVSRNELALAKAKLDKAKAELALAQAHLGFTEIRAPFDGIVGRFNDVRLGSLVDEGDLLTTLSDNSKMWVYFNVPEAEYLHYMTRRDESEDFSTVKLKMANNQEFNQEGVIETIEADFNNETGNIAFRATFSNPDRLLRHGETGNVLMPIKLTNALLIPQKATFEILNRKYVFTVGQDHVVKSTPIQVSVEMPHLYVVTSGVKPTDKLLVEGLRKVKNGDKIEFGEISQDKILDELEQLYVE